MELEAFASSNLIINFTTTPLIKLNAITKLVNHRQFSLPKLHEYLSFPNPALQNLQDGRWRQFGLLPFFGAMGCTSAIVFTCFGAAYGTAKSGVGICAMGVLRPDLIVKSKLWDT
ncbi:hypothetical protein ACEPPN_008643 [Leptodophora sp. 'Broadleaf-Isolate-01']